MALTAPFTGTVADVLGRKRVIVTAMLVLVVPTVMVALAPTLSALIFWRFVQGLVLPPIFAVTIAYIGDEWPRARGRRRRRHLYVGLEPRRLQRALHHRHCSPTLIGWRDGFLVLAAMTLVGAIAVMFAAAAREEIRALGRAARIRPADAARISATRN